MERPARNHEHAFPLVMNRPWPFPARINPCLDHLQHEEVVFIHQRSVNHLAFQIGVTLGDNRGFDDRAGHRREFEFFELVNRLT